MDELVDQSCRILYSSEAEFDRVRGHRHSGPKQRRAILRPTSFALLKRRSRVGAAFVPMRSIAMIRSLVQSLTFARIQETVQFPTLTKRERDVVLGLRSGRTSKHIAAELGLSTRTIEGRTRASCSKNFKRLQTHEVVAKFTSLES